MAARKQNNPTWLIVDGYNIIGSWPSLKEKANIQDARDALSDTLLDYCGFENYRLLLVFDAAAIQGNAHEEIMVPQKEHRIIFTQYGQTADQYIERFVREHEKEPMIVASSDQLIQVMIFSRAVRMSARELYIRINEGRADVKEQTSKLKPSASRLDERIHEDVAKKLELWRLGQYEAAEAKEETPIKDQSVKNKQQQSSKKNQKGPKEQTTDSNKKKESASSDKPKKNSNRTKKKKQTPSNHQKNRSAIDQTKNQGTKNQTSENKVKNVTTNNNHRKKKRRERVHVKQKNDDANQ